MMQIGLDEIREEDLKGLLGTTETLSIEFKSELNLAGSAQRSEAAKDISAFANSAGGRIFYGVSEGKQPNGAVIAEHLTPLIDRGLKGRLVDVIADVVHPRIQWRVREIDVEGGFVLVAEIYPSLGRDLHMVEGDRFYRRGEARTIRMSEPEIREAYARISISALALEQALATRVRDQEERVSGICQSVMIVPWYARRGLADPRVLHGIGDDLVAGPFKGYHSSDFGYGYTVKNIKVYAGGLRARIEQDPPFDLFVTREGLVHLADQSVLEDGYLNTVAVLENILVALRTARLVLDRCSYWGPVHVVQTLRVPSRARILMANRKLHSNRLDGGRYEQVLSEVNLAEQGEDIEPIARELCDQLFQALGAALCPLFNEDGSIQDEVRRWANL